MAFADVVTLWRKWMTRLSPALLLIVCTGAFFLSAGFAVGRRCGLACGFAWGFACGFACGLGCGFGCGAACGFGFPAWLLLLLLVLPEEEAEGAAVLAGPGCAAVTGTVRTCAGALAVGAGVGAGLLATGAGADSGPRPVKNDGVPAGGTAPGALHGTSRRQRATPPLGAAH